MVLVAEEKQADCVYFEAENISDSPDIKVKENGLRQAVQYLETDGSTLVKKLLDNKNYHAVPFLYFAKSDLYDRGLSFEEGIMFEDEIFSFELLRMCEKVVSLKEVLYYRNVREGSVMTSKGKEEYRIKSITAVLERLLEGYQNNKNDEVYKKYLARIALLWLGYYNNSTKQIKKQFSQKYAENRKSILNNKGFGNKEVVARCYGEAIWLMFIAPNRILKRIKR